MYNLNETLDRITEICVEALDAQGVQASGSAHFLGTREVYPYFVARVGDLVVDQDEGGAEEFLDQTITVILRLVIGHISEGYTGEPETNLYDYIPHVIRAFAERERLQSDKYPTAQDHVVRAYITGCSGLRVYEHAGIQAQVVGCEFTIDVLVNETIQQAYS